MIGGVDHIEIIASDVEAMADFLRTAGFEVVRETHHHGTSYELAPPGSDRPLIEIHTAEGEEAPGINHIAFSVDDIEEATRTLREGDVDQVSDPHFIEPTGRTITNFRDPDGRRFQFVAPEDEPTE